MLWNLKKRRARRWFEAWERKNKKRLAGCGFYLVAAVDSTQRQLSSFLSPSSSSSSVNSERENFIYMYVLWVYILSIPLDHQSFFAWLKCSGGKMRSSPRATPSSLWIVCKGKAAIANSLLSIVGSRWCWINKFYSSYFSLFLSLPHTITQATASQPVVTRGNQLLKKRSFLFSLWRDSGRRVVYPHSAADPARQCVSKTHTQSTQESNFEGEERKKTAVSVKPKSRPTGCVWWRQSVLIPNSYTNVFSEL